MSVYVAPRVVARRISVVPSLAAGIALAASSAAAQQAPFAQSARLDLTFARHAVNGGLIDFRTGPLFDALVAASVLPAGPSMLVVAGGGGVVFGGFGDRCLLRPGGGCAPKGNFVAWNLLAGADLPLWKATARALLGPSVYNGAGDASVGAQARLDLALPTLAHVGVGAMVRATLLPSHNGDRLVAWAVGGSLNLR